MPLSFSASADVLDRGDLRHADAATMRVVQIEPGPMPTFTPSAPWSTSALAPSRVAMLPPITCICGKVFFTHFTRSSTPCAWPCAVSTTITSDAGFDQRGDALLGALAHADRGADAQAAELVLARVRVLGRT
jgi:hypothetical protein